MGFVENNVNDVEVEPHLIKLTGEKFAKSTNVQEDARLDFSARNFWINGHSLT